MVERAHGEHHSKSDPSRFLLVQCCHPPQFIYLVRRLRARYPGARFDALLMDHEEVRRSLGENPHLERVFFMGRDRPTSPNEYDQVIFPLINRGYSRIKRAALAWRGIRRESDYEGSLRPLRLFRLTLSVARALHPPTPGFVQFSRTEYFEAPLGKKILVLESCDEAYLNRCEDVWRRLAPSGAEVTQTPVRELIRSWRRFRRQKYDSAVVFFSGEFGFRRAKLLPFLLRVPRILVFNENGGCFYASARSLANFLYSRIRHGVAVPGSRTGVLFVQTESPGVVNEALRKLRRQKIFREAEVLVVCRDADRRAIQKGGQADRLLTYYRSDWKGWMRIRREVAEFAPDVVAAVFSGQPIFRKQKAFFFLHSDRRQLVFNPELESYWLSPRTAVRILTDTPLATVAPRDERTPILFVQTESWNLTRKALRKLCGPDLYSRARVTLVCRAEDRSRFEDLPAIERVWEFPSNLREVLALRRRVRKAQPDAVGALFTGRPVFRKHKLLFLLLRGAPRLVFNSQLDCYWLGLRTFPYLFYRAQIPARMQIAARSEDLTEVLLLQTESAPEVREAIRVLKAGRAAGRFRLALLCSETEQTRFQGIPEIGRFYTYQPGSWGSVLGVLRQLKKHRRDVVSAVLSGRPIFRLSKLLFFLIPARNRLVFNENLDCYYLDRSRLGQRLRLPSFPQSPPRHRHRQLLSHKYSAWGESLRMVVKTLFFLPRFIYLLGWLVVAKLKRVRALEK